MAYFICNLHDDRVLCNHRNFDRYYIRSMWDVGNDLTIFQTDNLDDAKLALNYVKTRYTGSWVIINTRGEVVG